MKIQRINHTDAGRVLQSYALLQEAMGADSVEDIGSFLETISPSTNPAVVPRLVGSLHGNELVGLIAGAYLRELNMGFIAYSGVKEAWRGRGIYKAMRGELIALFNRDWGLGIGEQGLGTGAFPQSLIPSPRSPLNRQRQVSCIISELDESGWLYSKYVREWHGYALPCAYEQPAAQGLPVRPLKLVLQPAAARAIPHIDQVETIVRKIYEGIYRISDVTSNPSYRRILASIGGQCKMIPHRMAT